MLYFSLLFLISINNHILNLKFGIFSKVLCVNYISDSFRNPLQPEWIEGHSYGQKDAFYEAKGSYSLFYTCNTWANNALKAANQKASLWTVYDKGIFCHYK